MRSSVAGKALLRGAVAAVLALLLLGPAASAAQQRAQFSTRVDVVQFQARVTDSGGAFVAGLETGDFSLKVDGRERPISTVYEVNIGAPIEDSDAPVPPAAWRQWILFFDAAFNEPRGVIEAQRAAIEFVTTQAQERDLIGVATFNTTSGARLVLPLTRDHDQVLAAIGGLGLNQASRNVSRAGFLASPIFELAAEETAALAAVDDAGVNPEEAESPVDIEINELLAEMSRQVRTLEFEGYASLVAQYTEQMQSVGDMLRTIRGRKHVVYFSQGFDDTVLTGQSLDALTATTDAMQDNAGLALAQSSGEDRFGSGDVRASLEASLDVFRSADAVIHVVDPTGLGGGRDRTSISDMSTSGGGFNSRGGTRSALTSLADATGGSMHWETNDIVGALGQIEAANRSYYVIAFPRDAGDDEILELEVAVSRAGATVDAPEELAAPIPYAEMSPLERQLQLAEVVTKGIAESDLVFDVAAGGFYGDGIRNRVPVVIEIPWDQMEDLASSGGDDKVDLEVYTYALDDQDRMLDLSGNEVSLNMAAMRNSGANGLPFRYYDLLWAPPGERRVRVIIRDKELGRISAVTTPPLTIPHHASGEVAVSGPIGIDWDHPGLMMRGFKAETPPPHKAGGPVSYPLVVGENEVTPSAVLAGPPGSEQYAYLVTYNLGRDANGATQTQVGMMLQTATGEQMPLAGQQFVANFFDEATDGTQMVVKATLPADLPTGYYELVIMVNDQLKGASFAIPMPLWVTG